MTERVRVAVVGTGAWWGRQHAIAFSTRPDAQLCAVVGRNPQRTEDRAAEFRVPGYLDVEEMLDRERPDLVAVCLPNEGHFEPTLRIIKAGFPLLVEKPLVFDLHEADDLLAEAERRDLFFAINFNHRYAKPVQLAHDAVRNGALGRLTFATWRFGGEAGTSSHPHANLIETQCHGLDMLEHLCGPISSVTAQMSDATGRGYSTLSVALQFDNGAVGSLTQAHPLQAHVGETVRIFFGVGGPNYTSSFHVIGEVFDRVYDLASLTSPPLTNVQTITVPPGGASMVDL